MNNPETGTDGGLMPAGSPVGGLIGALHGQGGGLVLPKPFMQEIFLFETTVAGTSHVPDIQATATALQEGDTLAFFREPDNVYDKQAILVQSPSGKKLGYVPQRDNVIFARLMDAGKLLFGRVTSVKVRGTWAQIGMRVLQKE